MDSILMDSFEQHFAAIRDPRTRPVEHPLYDILFLSVCATIAGADGPSDIEDFGHEQIDWLSRFIPLENGIPSHDTIGRVFSLIKPAQFQEAFLNWIGTFRFDNSGTEGLRLIPIDGKTLCGSGTSDSSPLHLVSAWASDSGLSLGQVAVDKKSNEIKAIPKLLEMLELKGAVVTIDAMGCQRAIAKKIIDGGGNFMLAVKSNQPTLLAALESFFDTASEHDFTKQGCRCKNTTERSRGRDETRQYVIAPLPKSLKQLNEQWAGLKSIGRVLSVINRDGKETIEARYYICSTGAKVTQFATASRGHWSIENSLHWVLDVVFHEDDSQLNLGHSPENFGFLRRFVISLLKRDTSKGSLRGKRKRAAWSTKFLEKVLANH